MSLYPVSTFNLGTGVNTGGNFDTLGTAVLTDENGNIVATLSNGQITFVGSSIFNNAVYINNVISVGNGTGLNGQYLVSTGPSTAPQWITLSVGNGLLTINVGTHISGGGYFYANQSTPTSFTISCDATDANTVSTIVSRDSAGNFSAGTITANLTGTASLASLATRAQTIDITGSTGTFYIAQLTSGSSGTGQLLITNTGLTFATATGTLTATNFSGLASRSSTIEITNVGSTIYQVLLALSSGSSKTPYTSSSFYFDTTSNTLTVPSISTTASTSSTITTTTAPSGSYYFALTNSSAGGTSRTLYVDGGISYNSATDALSATTFIGALTGSSTSVATTKSPTTSATYYPVFVASDNTSVSQVVYTDGKATTPLSYNPNTGILTATGFSGGASGLNTTGTTTLGTSYIPFVSLQTGTNQTAYTDGTATPLTYNTNSQSLGVYNINANYVSTGSLYVSTNQLIYDQTTTSHYWNIQSNSDVLSFNNSWSSTNIPLGLNGDKSAILTNNQLANGNTPITSAEMDTTVVSGSTQSTAGTFNEGAIYISTTTNDYSSLGTTSYSPTTLSSSVSIPIIGDNPNSRIMTVAVPCGANFLVGATATGTFTINLTNVVVSMTRNGSSFTNWSFVPPTFPITKTYTISSAGFGTQFTVQQPFTMLYVNFIPTNSFASSDTYVITFAQTSTTSVSGGGTVIFQPVRGGATQFWCPINGATTNTISPNSTGFTFNSAPAIAVPMAIGKSLSTNTLTLNGDYVNANYLNLVYSKGFSSVITNIEQLCFAGGYANYNIVWYFSSAPTAYTSLYIDLVSKSGVNLGANWSGNLGILGSSYSSTAWSSTQAIICYMSTGTETYYYATITAPNLSRRKTITATNNGSASSSIAQVPMISCGTNGSAVAYPSLLWGVVGSAVNGQINVYGWN